MTKTQIKQTMKQAYDAGEKQYNKLWDALILLMRSGLLSKAEIETIKAYNHELSKT